VTDGGHSDLSFDFSSSKTVVAVEDRHQLPQLLVRD
ncbi:MAG: hypothetical protein ACJAYB_003267, partial [Psychromonas sp.]